MTEKEKSLLAGCISGDKASWDGFVVQYSALVYHAIKKTFAVCRTQVSSDLVEDLFQEIFLSIVKDDSALLRRFRGDRGCTLASWLRMIATRRTIDHLRRSNKPPNSLEASAANLAIDESKDERTDDQLQLLTQAIAKLQPRERILVDLVFRKNLPAQDVASILHISVGSVYTQKSRILAKLREMLKKSGSLGPHVK
jgi:RNA polymerase sigma-70 factor (ECF subfamily)